MVPPTFRLALPKSTNTINIVTTDIPTSQADLDSPPLRFPSQVSLGHVKSTTKINHHRPQYLSISLGWSLKIMHTNFSQEENDSLFVQITFVIAIRSCLPAEEGKELSVLSISLISHLLMVKKGKRQDIHHPRTLQRCRSGRSCGMNSQLHSRSYTT